MSVHRSALLLDTHNDIPSRTVAGIDIGEPSTDTHTDVPRLKQGGVGGVFFAVYVAAEYARNHTAANRALQLIDTVRHDIVAGHSKDFSLALTAAEIQTAHHEGRIAALMGIEGGHAIEDSPRLLRDFHALGVRYMTLTHTNTNDWADSSGDMDKPEVKHHNGLTPLGKQIVAEMNRIGMIVDISHVSDKTFWDALETSRAPIFASHSSCRALSNVPRNMTDEMIRALAKKRGVIQINFACEFLSQKSQNASKALGKGIYDRMGQLIVAVKDHPGKRAELAALRAELRAKVPPATLEDVVAHIDHVVKIAGVDAVGIGSDFDGVTCTPTGLEDVSKFPELTRALLEKGYSGADIRKIYGGNTLRLLREVEAVARQAKPL